MKNWACLKFKSGRSSGLWTLLALGFIFVNTSIVNGSGITSDNLTGGMTGCVTGGVTIAVVDSGVDLQHSFISSHIWSNPLEFPDNGFDDDANGCIDDFFGWNFADGDNLVFDRSLMGSFSEDHYRFLELQGKLTNNTITSEDVAWARERVQDEKFLQQTELFGNFIHGTHVAGISINKSAKNKVMSVKIISTKIEITGAAEGAATGTSGSANENDPIYTDYREASAHGFKEMALIRYLLNGLIGREMKNMGEIVKYLHHQRVRVANCSFGTSMEEGQKIVKVMFEEFIKRTPTPRESLLATQYFLDRLLNAGNSVYAQAPNTLFVFAAGNSHSNNDTVVASPANVKRLNTISVAATLGDRSLADFSNYGKKMVDVAAPGVAISSSVPSTTEDRFLGLSGTSQAAPAVSNIAAEVLNLNPILTPAQIKEVIMKTVDVKSFLRGKVLTSGMVNKQRAMKAAELSRRYPLSKAIALSRNLVKPTARSATMSFDSDGREGIGVGDSLNELGARQLYPELDFVLPLPSEFSLIKYGKKYSL
ncbi:MAG: S8 family serine peptidase [Oligoflexia bacterium]|nr:S8 family serine peptidase [Oligoflexia bacterium]